MVVSVSPLPRVTIGSVGPSPFLFYRKYFRDRRVSWSGMQSDYLYILFGKLTHVKT